MQQRVESVEAFLELTRRAQELRAVGATSANETSSRSHAILKAVHESPPRESRRQQTRGKLSLVDLAGSERARDSSCKDRRTSLEGAEINKSLLCLKECIRSLEGNMGHVPFRGSKLTQCLRESFSPHAKTAMIANISPGSSSAEQTLNTLRYAARVHDFSTKRQATHALASLAPPSTRPRAHRATPSPPTSDATPPSPPPSAPEAASLLPTIRVDRLGAQSATMHDPDESEGLLPAIDLGPQAALIARDRMAFAFEERRQRNKEQEMLELLHRCAPDKYAMALEQMPGLQRKPLSRASVHAWAHFGRVSRVHEGRSLQVMITSHASSYNASFQHGKQGKRV